MSSGKPQAMGFGEFCRRLNEDPNYMQRYRSDPASLIEQDLGISLSALQREELKKTVDTIFDSVPSARFYVVGEQRTKSEGKVVFH